MKNHENLELAREQIRIKNAELKKRAAEKERFDDRIKNITMVNHKRMNDLENKIAEKEDEIKYYQGMTASLLSRKSTKTTQEGTPIEKKATPQPPPIVELKEVPVHDPRLLRTIAELEIKNRNLANQIENEIKERNQLSREKTILIKEIRRLNEDSAKRLKNKAAELEFQNRERVQKQNDLLKEMKRGIEARQIELEDKTAETGKARGFSVDEKAPYSRTIERVHDELDKIKLEKDRIQSDLIKEKRGYQTQLHRELQQLSQQWGMKLKKIRFERKKAGQFTDREDIIDEIMGDEKAPAWMITYADMFTLLLTFFILYYSISSANLKNFREVILGEETASISLLELMDSAKAKESIERFTGLRSDNILTDIKDIADEEKFSSSLEVNTNDEAKIIIRISGQTLFESGKADLLLESKPVLDEIARILNKYPRHKINIQGHTDDEEISTNQFPSNWALSSARASAVLRFFLDKNIDPRRLTATGYADIFPVATNQTEAGKMKNRRVEFVLEKEK